MKRIFMSLLLIMLLSSASYGAVSGDVYVRQDVFDAKMEALFNRLDMKIEELRGDIKALSNRIDGLEKRIEDTHTYAYWFIITFVAVLALPFVNRLLDRWDARKSTVTLDDVRRLIAEAQLKPFTQG